MILEQLGFPPGMSAATFTKDTLLDHLGTDEVSPDLIEVLRAMTELGTPEVVDTMKAVADSYQVDLGAIVAHAPRDAAARLWLAQRQDAALREVYTRIQMQSEGRRSPRTFRECRRRCSRARDGCAPLEGGGRSSLPPSRGPQRILKVVVGGNDDEQGARQRALTARCHRDGHISGAAQNFVGGAEICPSEHLQPPELGQQSGRSNNWASTKWA